MATRGNRVEGMGEMCEEWEAQASSYGMNKSQG